ncbi:50S ribosomal protein L3 glutamine methyltransferase [Paenibacillus konkukensis]|uniref:peptide chain release factor N(5)-glutamine methyltransferase n=1 Tax=Paenibacillus konkukensis TaxID=2020716 RepID=A0ABY4RP57_9BACL|nr:putative protein N(5)-glutamine methyltransferase [Paenibacillus konkukensis]UQZ83107.1 50S ribosomal protein L3 glutamine methyltransferase [Paenibacillus konkukensis]
MHNYELNENVVYSEIVSKLRHAGSVFAEDEARLLISSAPTSQQLAAWVERRIAGVPVEYLIGWVEFCGLRIQVDPGVFVPRYRTEFLARQAAALVQPGAVVVDMCCGSGAIGAVVAAASERIELHAVDIDPVAVRCARRNIQSISGFVYEGDLYEPLPDELRGRVHVLIANAPYVPTEAVKLLPQEAREHESLVALDGGSDGLDVLRKIAAAAPSWLARNGCLLIETSERQAPLAAELLAQYGLRSTMVRSEEEDATVITGTRADRMNGRVDL